MSYINPAKSVEWKTPLDLFAFLEYLSGKSFQLDAAATKENALCKMLFTKEDDALNQNWFGNVFCNPPYGRGLNVWIDKALREVVENENVDAVTMLLPASTGTKWFHKAFMHPHTEMFFIKGRLKFSEHTAPAGFDSVVLRVTKTRSNGSSACKVGAIQRNAESHWGWVLRTHYGTLGFTD